MPATPEVHPDMEPHSSPSASTFPSHRDDILLRRSGYRILERPRSGEAVWLAPDGRHVGRAAALVEVAMVARRLV